MRYRVPYFLRSVLFVCLVTGGLTSPAEAQVVIRERVEAPPADVAPLLASDSFVPEISGTLRLRYISLQEGRYQTEASTWVSLTSHALHIGVDGSEVSDLLSQRFRYRARDLLRYGFYYENRYYQSRWSKTYPQQYYDPYYVTESTNFIPGTNRVVELGTVQAGVPVSLSLDYVTPDLGEVPLQIYSFVPTEDAFYIPDDTDSEYVATAVYQTEVIPFFSTRQREILVRFEIVPTVVELAVDPETVAPGEEAALSLTTNLPDDTEIRLGVGAGTVIKFVVPPTAARGATSEYTETNVRVRVDEVADVRIIADGDITEETPFQVNWRVSAEVAGRARGVVDPVTLFRFIRQDNTGYPLDSCLMVSRLPPTMSLPAPPVAYADVIAPSDPYTYRIEASGVFPNPPYTVEMSTVGQGGRARYTYPMVDNGSVPVRSYRMDRHIRFVSNATPSFGADPSAVYDDDVAGDQTLLVQLGDAVRVRLLDADGAEVAKREKSIGCESTRPDPHPQAIRTAELYVRNYVGTTSRPTEMAEKASEGWAQAAIRFEMPPANIGNDVEGVANVLWVDESWNQSGTVDIELVSDPSGTPTMASVSVPVSSGDTGRDVADRIAAAISAEPGFVAQVSFYDAGCGLSDFSGYWVTTNRGREVVYTVSPVNTYPVSPATFRFNPMPGQTVQLEPRERESLSLNYKLGPEAGLHVFTVPNGSMGTTFGNVVRQGTGLPASKFVVFIVESAMNGADATAPMTFGHELGHALGLSHASSNGTSTNLMVPISGGSPLNETESPTARKRLSQSQVDAARQNGARFLQQR